MAVREFPGDFETRYGHRPLLLESFVDTSHYRGTVTVQRIGSTSVVPKVVADRMFSGKVRRAERIFMCIPLRRIFVGRWDFPKGSGLGAIDISAGIDGSYWAENEFGGAPLGDERLSQRLVEIAADKAEQPGSRILWSCRRRLAKSQSLLSVYRQADDSAVTMSAILQPHRERTIQRMKAQKTVLCIQDGSDLNYSTLERCKVWGL